MKELAKETAKATDDIRGRIEAIQVDTGRRSRRPVSSAVIDQVQGHSTTIASTVLRPRGAPKGFAAKGST